jgi:hypothetical protein
MKKGSISALKPTADGSMLQGVQLSGSIADTTATYGSEANARMSKANGRFTQMQKLWGMKDMSMSVKMLCY